MTRIQLLIVLLLIAVICVVSIPKIIYLSRLVKAEKYALAIANGFKRYRADTGSECKRIQDLIVDPGVKGWLGPYINEKVLRNPWGGTYEVDLDKRKVGIPKGDNAPDKYEFGGSEEISFSIRSELK